MANATELATYITRINALYEAVSERRKQWETIAPSVLAQLRRAVEQVNSEVGASARVKPVVYESESYQGGKELSINFPRLPFGRPITRGDVTGVIVESGASLHFVPTFAGRIAIFIFGAVLDFPDRPKSEADQVLLGEVEPTALNNVENVVGYVEALFKYSLEKHWLQPGYKTVTSAEKAVGFRPALDVAKTTGEK